MGAGHRPEGVAYAARQEQVVDFAALIPADAGTGTAAATATTSPQIRLERVTAGVPWPRGLAWVDGKLVVLARGRHRRAGGVDPSIPDRCGALMVVDPDIAEPVVPGTVASDRVRQNAQVLAQPFGPPFFLYDSKLPPIADTHMDRPYCTLIFDDVSRNLFICGYSGVDLPGAKFRKNATDSIHRYDMRTKRWYAVEIHDAAIVATDKLSYVVPNEHYPHHDPTANPAPHGWLNGPDGGCVAGKYLYCVGKDNHSVARYDLTAVRRDPAAEPPPSQLVMGARARVRYPQGERELEVLGASAAAVHDGYMYLGYRTSSVVLRFRIHDDGSVVQPAVGELIAVFEPWDRERKRSANLIDIAFNTRGELFVSCAKEGRIWKVGKPDPERPFYGNDKAARPTTAPPYVDLRKFTGRKTGCGNILFDARDRLYICVGNYDSGTKLAGAVYRVVEESS
ncbi:MAG: hypothetical protein ACYTGO_13920 [Planctomycetota bacterium]